MDDAPVPSLNAARRAWLKGLRPGDVVAVADFADWLTPSVRYELCPVASREGTQVLISTGDGATIFSPAGIWTSDDNETPSAWILPHDAPGVREGVELRLAASALDGLGQTPGLAAICAALASDDAEVRSAAQRIVERAATMQADLLTVRANHK